MLNLAKKNNSQVHYAKGTPSHLKGAPTACRQTGSGSISLLYSRFFSPFPHGTGSLSVSREYLALRDGPRRFGQDFTCPDLLRISLSLAKDSCTGLSPSMALFPAGSTSFTSCLYCDPTTPYDAKTSMVWALARSLATTYAIIIIFSSYGYLDVSVPHVRPSFDATGLPPAGLPHSDIPASRVICTSTGLFAAYHVLHRLREPRHPPSALLLLFIFN